MSKVILSALFVFIFLACHRHDKELYAPTFAEAKNSLNQKKEIKFGPHPLHNAQRLQMMYGPIVEILNKEIPEVHFTLEASTDYSDYLRKIKKQELDIILPNPYQTIVALKYGYDVFGKMADDKKFRGIIVVKKNSNIKQIKDLIGKEIAFPAPSALAATMLPRLYLQNHGVDTKDVKKLKMKYVGTQESAVLAVINGESDACGTWPLIWDSFVKSNALFEKDLRILVETDSLVNNSLMLKTDLEPELRKKIIKVFLNLQSTAIGKEILNNIKIEKFLSAKNADYKIVDKFLTKYQKEFGELPL